MANFGSETLPALLDVSLWSTILLFALIALTLFYFLARHGQLRRSSLDLELPVETAKQAAPVAAAAAGTGTDNPRSAE